VLQIINSFIKTHATIICICLFGLLLRLFFANIDPFLHPWDEKFHALVASNMVANPLLPILRQNPILPYDANSWCCNYVWLHKQPLFMWQMAVSMKLFGFNTFAMRLPSAIMGTISIVLVYRICLLLTFNKNTAIIASLLMCFCNYQLELISGYNGMDHNDVAFSFYILASCWAFAEKTTKDKLLHTVLIGVFAGCAVLNKWLVGLLIFLPYGLLVLQHMVQTKSIRPIKSILISLACCAIICLPWQLYILYYHHDLALFEYRYNALHISNALEEHKGDNWFYYNRFVDYFGYGIGLLIGVGFIIVIKFKKQFNPTIHFSLWLSILIVFLFFSIIVQTKMPSYFFIVVPLCWIYIAVGLQYVLNLLPKQWLKTCVLIVILGFVLKPDLVFSRRQNTKERAAKTHNTTVYKNLNKLVPPHVKVVINMNSFEDIDVMFYNKNLTAYHYWIDPKYLTALKSKKVWIGAFKNHQGYKLPKEYADYPYLYIIDTLLQSPQ
jgi:4-amino-4-deoxy-L-arabinose transferase-like glycosyltransferase